MTLAQADTLRIPLPDKSVQTVVTSPPYWGLRDYGLDEQGIGLEATPDEYIANMVAVGREIWRVLRDDGTLWMNLGDSYSGGGRGGNGPKRSENWQPEYGHPDWNSIGLKPKDLCGIPWRVALALQADGWTLRSEIIWNKKNPMPESCTDRPTKAHETIFLFCKSRWTGGIYPPRRMNPNDARWIALLVETEGNIAVRRYTYKRNVPQHSVQVSVANSDRTILETAQHIVGKGTIHERAGTNRPVYYLQWTTKDAARILWECLPYMYGKKQQAICAIYLESRRDNKNKGNRNDIYRKDGRHYHLKESELELRESIWKAVKALNQHQPVDVSWIPEPKEGRWIPARYFYDADAVREEQLLQSVERSKYDRKADKTNKGKPTGKNRDDGGLDYASGFNALPYTLNPAGRNRRTVWTIATQPYSGAHFATFPEALVEPCIKAGTSERGCCPECGAGWKRQTKVDYEHINFTKPRKHSDYVTGSGQVANKKVTTLGFSPTCDHGHDPQPCVVLDPFAGSGTTGVVSRRLGRNFVGLDLSAEYLQLARQRLGLTALDAWKTRRGHIVTAAASVGIVTRNYTLVIVLSLTIIQPLPCIKSKVYQLIIWRLITAPYFYGAFGRLYLT